jgi:hypothetical protein
MGNFNRETLAVELDINLPTYCIYPGTAEYGNRLSISKTLTSPSQHWAVSNSRALLPGTTKKQ